MRFSVSRWDKDAVERDSCRRYPQKLSTGRRLGRSAGAKKAETSKDWVGPHRRSSIRSRSRGCKRSAYQPTSRCPPSSWPGCSVGEPSLVVRRMPKRVMLWSCLRPRSKPFFSSAAQLVGATFSRERREKSGTRLPGGGSRPHRHACGSSFRGAFQNHRWSRKNDFY